MDGYREMVSKVYIRRERRAYDDADEKRGVVKRRKALFALPVVTQNI